MTEHEKETVDPRARSLSTLPTSEVKLSPNFMADLKQVAPKKKRSKVTWVLGLVFVAAGAYVAARPSSRAFVAAKVHALLHRDALAATASAPPAASSEAPVVAAESAAPAMASASSEPVASAAPSAPPSASAAPSAKPAPHPHHRHHRK